MEFTGTPTLFLSCWIAVGFITATSLTLVNSVGVSLHGLRKGVQKYRGDEVEKRKRAIRAYPTEIFGVYLIIVSLFLVFILSTYLFDGESAALSGWPMVAFSAGYIVYILWTMWRACQTLFDAMRDDDRDLWRRE